jgi:hypothetical protein
MNNSLDDREQLNEEGTGLEIYFTKIDDFIDFTDDGK